MPIFDRSIAAIIFVQPEMSAHTLFMQRVNYIANISGSCSCTRNSYVRRGYAEDSLFDNVLDTRTNTTFRIFDNCAIWTLLGHNAGCVLIGGIIYTVNYLDECTA